MTQWIFFWSPRKGWEWGGGWQRPLSCHTLLGTQLGVTERDTLCTQGLQPLLPTQGLEPYLCSMYLQTPPCFSQKSSLRCSGVWFECPAWIQPLSLSFQYFTMIWSSPTFPITLPPFPLLCPVDFLILRVGGGGDMGRKNWK